MKKIFWYYIDIQKIKFEMIEKKRRHHLMSPKKLSPKLKRQT